MKRSYVASAIVATLVVIVLSSFVARNGNNEGEVSLVVASAFAQDGGANVASWEYKLVGVYRGNGGTAETLSRVEETLNQLASEGWELVSATNNGRGTDCLYFKRSKR